MNRRSSEIDIIKGISIILIILSHTTTSNDMLRNFLFSFHVPIFFVISGYFYVNNKEKIIKRVVLWGSLYLLLTIVDIICVYFFSPSYFTKDILINGFLCIDNQLIFNSPKWFLLVLAEIEVFYYYIYACKVKIKMLLCILAIILTNYVHMNLIFGVQMIFSSWLFFSVGDMLKPFIKKLNNDISKKNGFMFIACICACLLWLTSQANGEVSIQASKFGNCYLLFFINAFLGIFVLWIISNKIKSNKMLEFIGKNTLTFMCLHYYLVRGIFPRLKEEIYFSFLGKLLCTIAAILIISFLIKLVELIKIPKLKN